MNLMKIPNQHRHLAALLTLSCLGLSLQDGRAITVSLAAGSNNGPWSLTAGANTFNGPLNANASIDGVISGTGNLLLQGRSNNNGVVSTTLNVAHSYNGNTDLRSSNARAGFRLGIDNALSTSTTLSLTSTDQGTGRPVWLDLNGFSQQLGGFASGSTNYNAIVNGNTGLAGTLIVANGTNQTYNQFLGADNAQGNITSGATGILDGSGNNFSLIKSGVGQLTLTRANSYTGDTVINDGTLSIQSAYLFDSAAVQMSSTASALFELDFTGTDKVSELYIDGYCNPQAHGGLGLMLPRRR